MTKQPYIIQMSDIDFIEYPYAYCRSRSDDAESYSINYEERTCSCKGFMYDKKTPKTCAHLEAVLRFREIMRRTAQG